MAANDRTHSNKRALDGGFSTSSETTQLVQHHPSTPTPSLRGTKQPTSSATEPSFETCSIMPTDPGNHKTLPHPAGLRRNSTRTSRTTWSKPQQQLRTNQHPPQNQNHSHHEHLPTSLPLTPTNTHQHTTTKSPTRTAHPLSPTRTNAKSPTTTSHMDATQSMSLCLTQPQAAAAAATPGESSPTSSSQATPDSWPLHPPSRKGRHVHLHPWPPTCGYWCSPTYQTHPATRPEPYCLLRETSSSLNTHDKAGLSEWKQRAKSPHPASWPCGQPRKLAGDNSTSNMKQPGDPAANPANKQETQPAATAPLARPTRNHAPTTPLPLCHKSQTPQWAAPTPPTETHDNLHRQPPTATPHTQHSWTHDVYENTNLTDCRNHKHKAPTTTPDHHQHSPRSYKMGAGLDRPLPPQPKRTARRRLHHQTIATASMTLLTSCNNRIA